MLGHYLELLKAKWDKLGPVVIKEAGDGLSKEGDFMARNTAHHTHRVKSWVTVDFRGCVSPDQCTPEAHGDITDIATCSCGAVQKTNINRQYREAGPWEETDPARTEPTHERAHSECKP
jgi:hypothetical protein